MIDIDKELEILVNKIDSLPKDEKDINTFCAMVYSQYLFNLKIMNALEFPFDWISKSIRLAVRTLTKETYTTIIERLDKLLIKIKSLEEQPKLGLLMQTNPNTAFAGLALSMACQKFLENVPQSVLDLFNNINSGVIDITNGENIDLPTDVTIDLIKQYVTLKEEGLKIIMDTLYLQYIDPIIQYQDFISSADIPAILDKMAGMEMCMMKPGICNRPRFDFVNLDTNQLWSEYYKDKFLLNVKNELDLTVMTTDPQVLSWEREIINKVYYFRTLQVHDYDAEVAKQRFNDAGIDFDPIDIDAIND